MKQRTMVPVYVVSVDARVVGMIADKLVAAGSERRPGLIGLVEDGGTRECELLLAAGFDDAVATPISARELAGRVRAVDNVILRLRRKLPRPELIETGRSVGFRIAGPP